MQIKGDTIHTIAGLRRKLSSLPSLADITKAHQMEIKFELATEPAIKGTIAVVACVSIAYIATHAETPYGFAPPPANANPVWFNNF